MELQWLGRYRKFVEKTIKYGNAYARTYRREKPYGTEFTFSASEIQTLEYVIENEEKKMNMAELAARLGISSSAFSKNVKQMIGKGLLNKYHAPRNKKDVIIQVSPQGRQVYEDYCRYERGIFFDEILSRLDDVSPQDLERFTQFLDMLADSLLGAPEAEDGPLVKIE